MSDPQHRNSPAVDRAVTGRGAVERPPAGGECYIAVGADGAVTAWDVRAVKMFGWSAEEAVGSALINLVVPIESRAAHQVEFSRAVETGHFESGSTTWRMEAVRRDGTRLPVELRLGLLPAGQAVGVSVFVRDVGARADGSDSQWMWEELDKVESLWRRTFDDAPIGMAVLGPDSRFVHANQALLMRLGRSETELVGLAFGDITHAEDAGESAIDFQRMMDGSTSIVDGIRRFVRSDGQTRWARRTMSVLRGTDERLTCFLLQAQDVTAEHLAALHVTRRARTDELTGLGNRAQLVAAADSRASGCAVLLIDVDDFKRINNNLGHDAGDQVLIEVARRITRQCRPADLAVRLGRDEFAILLPQADNDVALAVGHRIESALDELIDTGAGQVKIDVSIGATVDAGIARPLGELLREADLALNACSASGKRRTRLFEPGILDLSRRQLRLETDLHQAVAAGELNLVYQPIVDLHTGRISGVEALSRWTHPTLGVISPMEFIPLAERTGLIDDVTIWVLTEATTTLAGWLRQRPEADALTVSVNVACSSLEVLNFAENVRTILTRAELVPAQLILEVTESGLANSQAAFTDCMWELARLGVRFAVDDFGTGYSCLARLSHLPFHFLKLDRSFIADIARSDDSAPLVHATLAMVRGLGMSMVAEGVETPAQLAYLQRAGCHYVQGFLTGRPTPAEQIVAALGSDQPLTLSPADDRRPTLQLEAVARAVASGQERSVDLDIDTIRELLVELAALAGMESTYLTNIHWSRSLQELEVVRNSGTLIVPEGLMVDWSDTLCRRALLGGPASSDDVPADYPDSIVGAEFGIQSYLTVPVIDPHGQLYGTLCGASTHPVPDHATHLPAFRLFARLIGERLLK